MKRIFAIPVLFLLINNVFGINSITTNYTITKVRVGQNSGEQYIVATSYEGTVLGIAYDGSVLWENKLSGYMNHDLWAEDITGDGNDEVFAANADGNIYCLNNDGTLKWSYKKSDAPMNSVCVVHKQSTPYVVCGGYDLGIYYLNANGTLNKEVHSSGFSIDKPWGGGILPEKNRSSTNFLRPLNMSNGTQKLAMIGTCNSMQSSGSIYIFDILSETAEVAIKAETNAAIGDMRTADIDGDGNDEIIMGASSMIDKAGVTVYKHSGQVQNTMFIQSLPNMDNFGYRVVQPVLVKDGVDKQFLTLFGSRIILHNTSLSTSGAEVLVNEYSYNDICYDTTNNKIILASAQSGGSCVHVIDLTSGSWKTEYAGLEPPGKLSKILANTETYRNQLKSFTKPAWEKDQEDVFWTDDDFDGNANSIMNEIRANYNSPKFLGYYWTDNVQDPADWGRDQLGNTAYRTVRDGRKTYNRTESQVLSNFASSYNDIGLATWGGHGNDPYYYSTQTLIKAIDQAAGKKSMLIFPELEHHDNNFAWVLDNHFYPIAEHAQGKNTVIFVRTKNIFWQSTAHMDLWDRMKSGEFADVFVPGMEETTDKVMDISVPGRVGYWLSGAVNAWGTRTARDNTSFDRLRQFSHQMVPNHFLRQYIYNVSLGAQYINNFNYNSDYMSFIWELIAKGALYVPDRHEILSLSPVHLSIVDVDDHYLNEGTNAKWTTFYDESTEAANPLVFNRMNGTWPGAPIPEWDFSTYATGAKDRRLNYLPPNENGLVTITLPQQGIYAKNGPRGSMKDKLHPFYQNNMKEFYTDGRYYYSADGTQKYEPDEYYEIVQGEIEHRAGYLPLAVEGDVAWVVAQSAEKHLRLTLIDGGYLNPGDKIAKVTFHSVTPVKIVDLVDGTEYSVSDSTANIDVPCGLFRFIDIELKDTIDTSVIIPESGLSARQVSLNNIHYYPNPVNDELNFETDELLASVTIFDVNGRTVKYCDEEEINSGTIRMSDIDTGYYIVKWMTYDGNIITSSVLKK